MYMDIKQIYKSVIDKRDVWDYYNSGIKAPVFTDYKDCSRFIMEYIRCSEKNDTELYRNIKNLEENSPQRLSHIVSTFFLGLWLFHNSRTCFVKRAIIEKLKNLRCFHNNDQNEIERQLTFVWFMASLFHDLGYPAEESKNGEDLPCCDIPYINSIPKFYCDVYKAYYCYREKKEHGIYAGLNFDESMCAIRKQKVRNADEILSWREDLEDLYHYVAWVILAHNIWMVKDDDIHRENAEGYRKAKLDELILSVHGNGNNIDYKFAFEDYPLFTFFCLVDTVEPLKSSCLLSDIDIQLKKGKIIVKSNDSVYIRKIAGLNDWLVPILNEGNVITINLNEI